MPDQHCGSDMYKIIWIWVKQNGILVKKVKMFLTNNSCYNRIEHDKDGGAMHCGVRGTQELLGASDQQALRASWAYLTSYPLVPLIPQCMV